ncbi:MAG: hypothetical protein U0802_14510 [Candidatus Binatia bacterium]
MNASTAGESTGGVDRKRVVVLLRSVVIATCAYLALAGQGLHAGAIAAVAVFALSNVGLALAPRQVFYLPRTSVPACCSSTPR